jgi:hypothetical protein
MRQPACRICGCTQERACPQGCAWVRDEHLLCTACSGTPADFNHSINWALRLLKLNEREDAAQVLRRAQKRWRNRKRERGTDE